MTNIARSILTGYAIAAGAPLFMGAQTPARSNSSTPDPACETWALMRDGSTRADSTYNRCALDKAPVWKNPTVLPPNPVRYHQALSDLMVVVNADGSVDPRLTHYLGFSPDSAFHNRVLETVAQWKFDPGVRNGKPVRSAIRLKVSTGTRREHVPSTVQWTYRTGKDEDLLIGQWNEIPADPPFNATQSDSIYVSLLRHLVRTHIIPVNSGRNYCLVLASNDADAHARLSSRASELIYPIRSPTTGRMYALGCEHIAGTNRIHLPTLIRTENSRVAVELAGDHLPSYPAGLDGRAWSGWKGRCVAQLNNTGAATADCTIDPNVPMEEIFEWQRALDATRNRYQVRPPPPPTALGHVRLSLYATMRGAFQVDTMQKDVVALPTIASRAVTDTLTGCGSWGAATTQNADDLFVLSGDPSGTYPGAAMNISRISYQRKLPAAVGPKVDCQTFTRHPNAFALFLLGGVGKKVDSTVAMCLGGCSRRYLLDPQKHTLAAEPTYRFRISDLRADTQRGSQLDMRVKVEEPMEGFMGMVVLLKNGVPWRPSGYLLQRTSTDSWDYRLNFGNGYPPDTEILLYFFRNQTLDH